MSNLIMEKFRVLFLSLSLSLSLCGLFGASSLLFLRVLSRILSLSLSLSLLNSFFDAIPQWQLCGLKSSSMTLTLHRFKQGNANFT